MEGRNDRAKALLGAVTKRGLSANAQLVLAMLLAHASGDYCYLSRVELLKLLDGDWYARKLDRALRELYARGVVTRITEGDVQAFRIEEEQRPDVEKPKPRKAKIKVNEPPEVQELVAHFVRHRMSGQSIDQAMWRRMYGQAKKALASHPLADLKACIEFLNEENWWKDKNWSLTAVHTSGMVAFLRHRSKQSAAPGALKVASSGEVRFGVGSLMRPEYDKGG